MIAHACFLHPNAIDDGNAFDAINMYCELNAWDETGAMFTHAYLL